MTKDEKTRVEVRDGVEYACTPVTHDKKQVGYAPRRKTADLDEMLDFLSPEKIHSLADRQLDTDTKNAVRGKYLRDAVKATGVINGLNKGTLKMADIERLMQVEKLGFVQAGAKLLGVGKDAKIEPDKIHWDVVIVK